MLVSSVSLSLTIICGLVWRCTIRVSSSHTQHWSESEVSTTKAKHS